MDNAYYKTVKYESFHDMLHGLYKTSAEKSAFKFVKNEEAVSISYRQFIQQISNLFSFFQNQNFENQNMGIISENRYEYISLFISISFQNVTAPIDKDLPIAEIRSLLQKFDIKVLFYTDKLKSKVEEAAKDLPVTLMRIEEEYPKMTAVRFSIEDFFEAVENIDIHRFSILAFTSGTSGAENRRGVMLSQNNIVSNLEGAIKNNRLKSPTLVFLPMNHTYGFSHCVFSPLYHGDTLCLNMNIKELSKDFKRYNPCYIGVVPMVAEGIYNTILREVKVKNKQKQFARLIRLSNQLRKYGIDLRHLFFGSLVNRRLRLMVCGGAPMNSDYIVKYEEIGITLVNGYGLTECSPLVSVNRDVYNVCGSVGTVIDEVSVRIAEDGEILVKGPNVMLGYYHDEQATKDIFTDGYLHTGDVGYLEDRILYVTGRKKNIVVLPNGKKILLEEIEEKLSTLNYVKECLARVENRGNTVVIIADIYTDATEAQIQKDLPGVNALLPGYMQIQEFHIVDKEFRKTSMKKIIRE